MFGVRCLCGPGWCKPPEPVAHSISGHNTVLIVRTGRLQQNVREVLARLLHMSHTCNLLCRMLNEYNVVLDAILLKPNMVLPGAGHQCLVAGTVSIERQLSAGGAMRRRLSARPARHLGVRCSPCFFRSRQQSGFHRRLSRSLAATQRPTAGWSAGCFLLQTGCTLPLVQATLDHRTLCNATGLDAPPAKPEDVAKYTVRTCLRTVPPAVPGIHFLRYPQSCTLSKCTLHYPRSDMQLLNT